MVSVRAPVQSASPLRRVGEAERAGDHAAPESRVAGKRTADRHPALARIARLLARAAAAEAFRGASAQGAGGQEPSP
jgi:hypothetical protein